MPDVALLVEIAFNKSLHVGLSAGTSIAAEDLYIDRRKVMVGIGIKLALEIGLR
jgi:hypothetical protein